MMTPRNVPSGRDGSRKKREALAGGANRQANEFVAKGTQISTSLRRGQPSFRIPHYNFSRSSKLKFTQSRHSGQWRRAHVGLSSPTLGLKKFAKSHRNPDSFALSYTVKRFG
jgi:hypothetical protein